MEKTKISKAQAMMLAIASITVTGHLLFLPVLINHSGRDIWLALLAALVPAVFIGYVVTSLSKRYPGMTLVDYSQEIIGKWPGKLLAFLFIFYFFHDATLSIRGFGEFFTSAITPRTPILVYFTAIVALSVYAIRHGLEVLTRTNQVFLVIMIPIGILASILTQKDKDYKNFLPILEYGPEPMLMGMISLISLFSTFIVLGMVLPHIDNTKNIRRFGVLTMILLIIMFIGPMTGPVAIFGAERSSGLTFPSFQILRDVQIWELQRLDLLGILLWSMGSFAKISVFLYAVCLGISQLFKLDDHRILAVPVGALLIIVSLLNSDNYIEIYRFLKDSYPYYSILMGLVLPTTLLLIARFRQRKTKMKKG